MCCLDFIRNRRWNRGYRRRATREAASQARSRRHRDRSWRPGTAAAAGEPAGPEGPSETPEEQAQAIIQLLPTFTVRGSEAVEITRRYSTGAAAAEGSPSSTPSGRTEPSPHSMRGSGGLITYAGAGGHTPSTPKDLPQVVEEEPEGIHVVIEQNVGAGEGREGWTVGAEGGSGHPDIDMEESQGQSGSVVTNVVSLADSVCVICADSFHKVKAALGGSGPRACAQN